jgi:hypothetical protein
VPKVGNKMRFILILAGIIIVNLINVNILGSQFSISESNHESENSQINSSTISPEKNQSSSLPSFHPIAFHSGTGRLHLLFQHEVHSVSKNYYFIDSKYYHIFKLENGSWSHPKKLENPNNVLYSPILHIEPMNSGFTIFFFSEGLYKRDYNEQENIWSESILLFEKSDILSFLDVEDDIFMWFHTFSLSGDNSYYVAWSFAIIDELYDLSHEYERQFIISKVELDGSIVSQTLNGSKERFSRTQSLSFISRNGLLFLYNLETCYRAILSSNGEWSNWKKTSFTEKYDPINIRYMISDRYSVVRTFKKDMTSSPVWLLIDYATENVTTKNIEFPFEITYYRGITFRLNNHSQTDNAFICSVITHNSIELWELDYNGE